MLLDVGIKKKNNLMDNDFREKNLTVWIRDLKIFKVQDYIQDKLSFTN